MVEEAVLRESAQRESEREPSGRVEGRLGPACRRVRPGGRLEVAERERPLQTLEPQEVARQVHRVVVLHSCTRSDRKTLLATSSLGYSYYLRILVLRVLVQYSARTILYQL